MTASTYAERLINTSQGECSHQQLRGTLLADFGLAVIVEDLTQMPISSALEGSGNPRWMAPELLVGQEIVSKSSDIWSLGMFFLEVRIVRYHAQLHLLI